MTLPRLGHEPHYSFYLAGLDDLLWGKPAAIMGDHPATHGGMQTVMNSVPTDAPASLPGSIKSSLQMTTAQPTS